MKPCEVCGRPGQKHHIVFRSQGGLDIEQNFAYLCPMHHTDGPEAVHNNRLLDLRLKEREQRELENLFPEEAYHLAEVGKTFRQDRKRLLKSLQKIRRPDGRVDREALIRMLMGERLYKELEPAKRPEMPEKGEGGFIPLEEQDVLP